MTLFTNLICLYWVVESVTNDKEMKTDYPLSAGVLRIALKTLFNSFDIDLDYLKTFGGALPADVDTDSKVNIYEHGAAYILAWAMLTVCVAKVLYFNTLFTMSRAMNVFISLKPLFHIDDDENGDDDGNQIVTAYRKTKVLCEMFIYVSCFHPISEDDQCVRELPEYQSVDFSAFLRTQERFDLDGNDNMEATFARAAHLTP